MDDPMEGLIQIHDKSLEIMWLVIKDECDLDEVIKILDNILAAKPRQTLPKGQA